MLEDIPRLKYLLLCQGTNLSKVDQIKMKRPPRDHLQSLPMTPGYFDKGEGCKLD